MRLHILYLCTMGMALLVPSAAAEEAASTETDTSAETTAASESDASPANKAGSDNPYLSWEPVPETQSVGRGREQLGVSLPARKPWWVNGKDWTALVRSTMWTDCSPTDRGR